MKFEQKKPKAVSEASAVDNIFRMVSMPDEVSVTSGETRSFTAQIDSILQQILKHIYSDESFRKLESVWRGLKFIMQTDGVNGNIEFGIVPVSFDSLEETLDHLLPDLVENPPHLILLDLPFDNSPRSTEILEKIAAFSETLLAPSVCWINPSFLYLDAWQDLNKLPFLPHYLEEPVFAKWRQLKKNPAARWVAVCCNRFSVRYPYGPDNKSAGVDFHESEGLFVSPVWALGGLVCQSFVKTGWPTRFTEWQNIKLEDLALTPSEDNKLLSTETFFDENRHDQLIRSGIIPLISAYNKDTAFMPAETTISGGSLRYHLFLAIITRFIFWCKDNFEKDLGPIELENNIKQAFLLFWHKTGHPGPKDLQISVSKPVPDQPAIMRIIVEPPRDILSTGEKVELEFNW
jgi:predicted component of type VI protein secretion system